MKKTLFTFIFLSIILSISYSQSTIVLKDVDGNVINDQILAPSTDFLSPTYFSVENTGNSEITILIDVTELTLATDGGDNYAITFCWGGCFPPITRLGLLNTIPATAHTIPANSESSEEADIYIVEDGATENSSITFKFYEEGNESNFTTLSFDTDLISSVDNIENYHQFSAFPNPAKENLTISYNVENIENTFISIYNVLGKEVKKIKVENNNQTKINVSDLNSGIYFYNLSVNNKIVNTKKLIITK